MSGSHCGRQSTSMSKDHAKRVAGMFLSNTQTHRHTQIQRGVGDAFYHSVLQPSLISDSPPFSVSSYKISLMLPTESYASSLRGISQPYTLSVQHLALSKFPSLPLIFIAIEIENINLIAVGMYRGSSACSVECTLR